jgi:hypothetical protein
MRSILTPGESIGTNLYWHESVENDPANRWLRDEIEKVLNPESQVMGMTPKPGSKRQPTGLALKSRKRRIGHDVADKTRP